MHGISKAERFIADRFFCNDTGLIYDFLVDDGNAWHHLPSPEDIKKQNPNPCGWGVGMEDSMLNAGSVMDALIARFYATGEEKIKKTADSIFRGMMLCATVSSDNGFIARSVSPVDKKSFYYNSSRDQYTHWVYGAVRFFDSILSSKAQKHKIRQVLVAIAEKAAREVTQENSFNMLRADGKVGIVCKMWGDIGYHEFLRLPMFYAAAYHVSGDEKWKKLCDRYKYYALEQTKHFEPFRHNNYVLLQVQYSLRLMYDLSYEPEFKSDCMALMISLAEYGEKKFYTSLKNLKDCGRLDFKYGKWNEVPHTDCGEFGGYRYMNPAQSEWKENRSFYPLRGVGETASVAALCYERKISPKIAMLLDKTADSVDYDCHYSYAPLLLFCGYWLCKENEARN